MSFVPSIVKDQPVVSAFLVLGVLGGLAVLAVNFSQGTFVDDEGCGWTAFNNPEGGNFTSRAEVQTYFEENGRQVPDQLELDVRDGTVYQKIPDSCGTVGGES